MAGPRTRPIPTRTCVACRVGRPKRELLRVVRTPDGRVAIDAGGRTPGRGAYVCAACRRDRRTKGALERALGTRLAPELLEELDGSGDQMTDEGGARGQE